MVRPKKKSLKEYRLESTQENGRRSALPCLGCVKVMAEEGVAIEELLCMIDLEDEE